MRRIGILQAVVKDSAAVFVDPAGWTKLGEQVGGTGAAADDVGTTKLAVWFRIFDGTETVTDVTITNDVGVSSGAGMSIYAPSAGREFPAPIYVSGSDDVHATDWNPVGFAGWSEAIGPGDVILSVKSFDDDAADMTAGFMTQAGIQTSNEVSRMSVRSSTGPDCGLITHDSFVNTGSNMNAPSYTITPDVAVCGATMLIRLREEETGAGVIQRQLIVGP